MLTEQMLGRSPALAALNPVAAVHHEKADGSGYHKGLRADATDRMGRLLAAVDVYVGLTTERAERAAFAADDAASELPELALRGVIEQATTDAVLAAAGQRTAHPSARRIQRPGGLSGREVEVLRPAAMGLTTHARSQTGSSSRRRPPTTTSSMFTRRSRYRREPPPPCGRCNTNSSGVGETALERYVKRGPRAEPVCQGETSRTSELNVRAASLIR